jgi:hypothetical protein
MSMSRILSVGLAAILLLAAAQFASTQEKKQTPPPQIGNPKEDADLLLKKAFGADSEELKRPIRIWVADIGMVVAAKEAKTVRNGSFIHFASASIALLEDPTDPKDLTVFRGDEIIVAVDRPVTKWSDLADRAVTKVEVHEKKLITTISPAAAVVMQNAPVGFSTSVPTEKIVAGAPVPPFPMPSQLPVAPPLPQPVPPPPNVMTAPSIAQIKPLEIRFTFKIDPTTPVKDLLPAPAKTLLLRPAPLNEDLAKVPEISFGEPIAKTLSSDKAMKETVHAIAKINHLNQQKADGFMEAMIAHRFDLRGLPVLMGDDCRTREEQAKVFKVVVNALRQTLAGVNRGLTEDAGEQFWADMPELKTFAARGSGKDPKAIVKAGLTDPAARAWIAALMQILMPESESFRIGLAKHLATIPHVDATKALAKLAIYAPEDAVRAAAVEGLKLRREKDYTDLLLQGLGYPLPAVSKRAAEAIVKLDRQDLLVSLVAVLEQPDPRLPVKQKVDDKEVLVVRELVRVNHHRNCVLCHAPGNTENTPDGALKVSVPLPTEPLPTPAQGGYQNTQPPTPDLVVRIDMTYLRQDFSVMMPVKDAHPWPDMQRFDFLVRTRVVTPQEAEAYDVCCDIAEPGRLSPYHRSALFALRELTGRDTEPTAAAWRKLLNMPASK